MPSKKPSGANWLAPFAGAWAARFGAAPSSHGYLAAKLSPLVDAHGTDEVLERWCLYLGRLSSIMYASPRAFAEKYEGWVPLADPAIARALAERDRTSHRAPAGVS